MRAFKTIMISIGLIAIAIIFIFYGSILYNSWKDSQFFNIDPNDEKTYKKPIEYLNDTQIDSLKSTTVSHEKLLVIGSGFGGYDFYMWHKPTEKGEIYIKAFELTKNKRLSEWKITNRTKNTITELTDTFKIYKGSTVIDEGTFEKYYPARFELWFKSSKDGQETKLADEVYLIDGWDR